jgi:hypothetical protein
MKKNILVLFVGLLGFSPSICAQEKTPATPEERATKLTEWMKSTLRLNDSQVSQVQTINSKYAQKNEEIKSAGMGKRKKMQTLKANETGRDAELKTVLTPEQYTTYETKKDEMKKMMKEKAKEKQ